MEPTQSQTGRIAVVAAIAAIVGGAIMYAIAPSKSEFSQLQMQRDTLNTEIEAFKQRMVPLQAEVKTLQEQNTTLKAETDRLAKALTEKEQVSAKTDSALGDRQRAVEELEKRRQAIAAENEKLKKTLGATGRNLSEAQARAAELNKSYEALLKEKTTLTERAAARRGELETTRKSLEEAQNEVARLTGARGIYTVQNGDSLSIIATFFYRNGLRWSDIFKANSFLISHPDLIYPKQVLIVPQ